MKSEKFLFALLQLWLVTSGRNPTTEIDAKSQLLLLLTYMTVTSGMSRVMTRSVIWFCSILTTVPGGVATVRSVGLAINRSWVQILLEAKAAQQPWASCSHICASITKQYNLVPAKGRWCSAAGKVTAGLAESNGSPPPGGWLIVTCGLTACTPGSALGPVLSNEYGKPLPFLPGPCQALSSHDVGYMVATT